MQRTLIWFLILFLLLVGCRPQGSFKPERAEETPAGDLVRRPLVVSFEELDANPRAFQNRLLRVTGELLQVDPLPCAQVNGPAPQWALINQDLRLNGRGFGPILELVPEASQLTVDGFWRRYRGPLGCGKEPAADTLWYLEAIRLVQPNPFPGIVELLPTGPAPATIEPLESPSPSPTATATATGTPTPTMTATVTGTPPTTTPPTTEGEVTATQTLTPSPSATLRPGETTTATPSATASSTPSPTATLTGASTPTLSAPSPTSDPSSYPPPSATPDPYD